MGIPNRKFKIARLWFQQKGCCAYCGLAMQMNRGTLDHIKPRSLGGKNGIRNLVMSCHGCNKLKAAMPVADFLRQYNIKPLNEIRSKVMA